jgi:ferredoxin
MRSALNQSQSQCVSAAPSSFKMNEDGRATTFSQRSSPDVASAVAVCPVDCMHHVSFHELKELESARDHGDGRTDHRHMGGNKTPLNVSGITSDANHRSSWYQ